MEIRELTDLVLMAAVLQTFTTPLGHARPPVGVTPVICPCDPYALWVCWLPDTL